MEKDKVISEEIKKLNKIFKDLPESKKKLTERLIQNAAFMAATLAELQEIIDEEGPVKLFTNGNGFEILQEHPAQKSYIAMIAKYNSTMKQLLDLLPDSKTDTVNKAGDALAKFVVSGKKVEVR